MDLVFNKSLVNCKHEQPLGYKYCDVITMSLASVVTMAMESRVKMSAVRENRRRGE